MLDWLPKGVKSLLRRYYYGTKSTYYRYRHPFTTADLLSTLRELGISDGDVMLVHSSFAEFLGFRGKAPDVIRVLKQAVGPHGTLMMPTLSFSGSAAAYAREAKLFDLARSPSKVGLLTELFRRSEGVVRSLHPTHSVAVWGPGVKLPRARPSSGFDALWPWDPLLSPAGKARQDSVTRGWYFPIDILSLRRRIDRRRDAVFALHFGTLYHALPCERECGGDLSDAPVRSQRLRPPRPKCPRGCALEGTCVALSETGQSEGHRAQRRRHLAHDESVGPARDLLLPESKSLSIADEAH